MVEVEQHVDAVVLLPRALLPFPPGSPSDIMFENGPLRLSLGLKVGHVGCCLDRFQGCQQLFV